MTSVVEGVMLPSELMVKGEEEAASTFWTWFTEATVPTRSRAKTKMIK
jgi:hypothetical protein